MDVDKVAEATAADAGAAATAAASGGDSAPLTGRKRTRAETEAPKSAAKTPAASASKAAAKKPAASTASKSKAASTAKKPAASKPAAKGKAPAKGRGKKADEDDEDSEDEDSDDGEDDAPAGGAGKAPAKGKASAAAAKKPAATSAASKAKAASSSAAASAAAAKAPPAKRAKAMKPVEMVEAAMKAFKWWEAEKHPAGIKWRTMEHRGVCFPPAYVPHSIPMYYDGKPVTLTPDQEELATFYAGIAPDGPQLGVAKTAKIFNKNFWADFSAALGSGHAVKDFSKCDFAAIRAHLDAQRAVKKGASKEDKDAAKAEKERLQLQYGFALVDGHIEKMGNYTVEPPGLFRGRGEHPKMGTVKRRVMPEDITLNVGSAAVVPPCPLPGHAWKRVVHDPTVTWLAYWKENVMGGTKYVFLSASSSFKGKSDLAKYEKARRLVKMIDGIRKHYEKLLTSDDDFQRQSGTAMWIIDRLALRVGGEKDEDEADTVGCCSLRVEHISFPGDNQITLDFLGKDSMRYHQTIDFERYGHIGKLVRRNLQRFADKKKPGEDIFDYLTPARLNEQLDEQMPGLSAKVFRTYNASVTLERELENLSPDTPGPEKVLEYNRANREVAILCNHQRTVPKAFEKTWEKMTGREALLLKQVEELEAMAKDVKKGGGKVKVKSDYEAAEKEAAAAAGTPKRGSASSSSSSAGAAGGAGAASAGAGEDDEVETPADRVKRLKEEEAHLFSKQPSGDEVAKRLSAWRDKLEKHRLDMRNKDENKAVALGTSKINYMDPRITVAWCKRVELPIERVFPRTLRDKFPWAMGAPTTFKF